jgi:hypothetical protein
LSAAELLRALEQEEQLRRQRARLRILVEALEERILRVLLEHQLGLERPASRFARLVLPTPIGPSTTM